MVYIFLKEETKMFQTAETRIKNLLATVGIEVNGPHPYDPQIHDPAVYQQMVSGGTLAIGEAYMDGLWDCAQLDELINRVGAVNAPIKHLGKWNATKTIAATLLHNRQRLGQAAKNATHHYAIGNDLYEAMLGKTLAYSCGYWEKFGGPTAKGAKTLDAAQQAKFDLICKKLGFKPGMRVLDIGCGWGGFLLHAVKKYKVEAVGITPVEAQVNHIRKQGLPIDIRKQDWRELKDETFDRVVSIGMFEHVGPQNYRGFFQKSRELLKPDGLTLLHAIGAPKTRYTFDPWINKYIFPGGHIPPRHRSKRPPVPISKLSTGMRWVGTTILRLWRGTIIFRQPGLNCAKRPSPTVVFAMTTALNGCGSIICSSVPAPSETAAICYFKWSWAARKPSKTTKKSVNIPVQATLDIVFGIVGV